MMNPIVKLLISIFGVLSLLCVPLIVAGEPYAPLYKFTDKDFNNKFGKMGITIEDAEMMEMWPPVQAKNVPDKGAIAAPAYPGAVIIDFIGPYKPGGEPMGLSTLELLSSDSYEKVITYYKEKLPAWNETNNKGASSYYLAVSGEAENAARNMKVPHIGFMNLEGGILGKQKYTGIMPNARTLILVFFQE